MRLSRLLVFLLLIVVGSVSFITFPRDFTAAIAAFSFLSFYALCPILVQHDLKKWLVPCGFVLALFLICLCYIASLLILPYSPQIAHRLQVDCFFGPIFAFGQLLSEVCSPAQKRVTEDHAVNGTAIERRR